MLEMENFLGCFNSIACINKALNTDKSINNMRREDLESF